MHVKSRLFHSLFGLTFVFAAVLVEAGSVVIPAWSFDRGNVRVDADPAGFADAGPVVVSGERKPWGYTVEYDVDVPVTAAYTLQICYAAAEVRPIEVFFDGQRLANWCSGVTFGSAPTEQPDTPTFNSSGAKWEGLDSNPWNKLQPITKGKHTVKITRSGPLPHLVALRLDTPTAFPEDWRPPQHTVRDLESIPPAYRKAFSKVAVLPPPGDHTPPPGAAGSLEIPAWTFDRGNVRIYASPDEYADTGPLAGGGPQPPEEGMVEYDIEFPVTAEYTLQISYAAAEARPVDVLLDGKNLGKCCTGVTFGSAAIVLPVELTWTSRFTRWEGLYDHKEARLLKLSVTKGRHTLKFTRRGPLPNLAEIRLDSSVKFPSEWKQPERKVDLSRVPAAHRAAFLSPDAVNVAALRLAIQDTMATSGPQYPGGPEYLKQLAELEAKQSAAQRGTAEDQQKIEDSLQALRSRAMLAHPALMFDKLLFLKRGTLGYGHTYADQHFGNMGGNLCILSPVSPSGKVTPLVPELDGGLFDRFDLSFDAKKVVFGYRKKSAADSRPDSGSGFEPFRIYEIDIDPVAGKMVPGSLRQLTFSGNEEAEWIRGNDNWQRCFHDMDPCYLPNGKIMFVSTRAMRGVYCASGASVTTLYLMDADGKNMRRISESPLNETAPSLLEDGRVIYTRWEYVDKGLGNAETIWAMRPDGTGSDHVYKLNTVWPAGMSSARGIPGSRRIVAVAGNHYLPGKGPVVLVDNRRSRRSEEAMHCITPEIGYPSTYSYTTRFGAFMDPYPFSEKFFLVSHTPGSKVEKYGLYVLDAWGNRAELYQDPDISCFESMPLRPRRRPTEIAAVAATDKAVAGANAADEEKTGTLFIQDVYEGMTGIERGRVKYVRVMGALEGPWSGFMPWSLGADPHRKKVYGIAKVHADGSAFFTAPSDENLFFQALDENFMALQQMSTFINLMPGENRSCIGCHESRRKAPRLAAGRPMAVDHPAQKLAPQPGDTGPRMVDFAADVQPTLDKHCVGCHSGKQPKGRLDLVGVPMEKYSRSYSNLTGDGYGNGLINFRACGAGSAHIRAVPPLTHGSLVSKLTDQIRQDPCKANLTREEFIKIATWIDANVPYYGTYRGKIYPQDKDHPDFRALPLVGK
jgi:hypothetical protein